MSATDLAATLEEFRAALALVKDVERRLEEICEQMSVPPRPHPEVPPKAASKGEAGP